MNVADTMTVIISLGVLCLNTKKGNGFTRSPFSLN
jgi:hypothetical protein